jgi:hypothetical protein
MDDMALAIAFFKAAGATIMFSTLTTKVNYEISTSITEKDTFAMSKPSCKDVCPNSLHDKLTVITTKKRPKHD